MNLNIIDTFNLELPADPILENSRRQVKEACFSFVTPRKTSKPQMLHVSPEMLKKIGAAGGKMSSVTSADKRGLAINYHIEY